MATSPECVRVVLGAARTFSDLALDALREAVLLIDTRQHHKPVLLANAAAARFFVDGAASASLLDSCLYEWLRPAEAEAVEATIAGLSRHQAGVSRIVTWRSAAGETPVMTDFKLIDGAAGQRIVMLNFECRAVRIEGRAAAGMSLSVRDITEQKRLEREILEVTGRERQRIGRDLHDGLGQELTGIALMMRALARRLERDCPGVLGPTNEIVALVNQSIDSTRRLARGLLPVSSEQGGLLAALRGLADRSHGQYGLEVRFNAESWPEIALDETMASHLFRIAQEALTNAVRHAQASVVDISLQLTDDQFRLKIADNGCGMPNSAGAVAGLGTKIMAHRACIIGARFEIMRNPGGGTIVQVTGRQP